MENRKRLFIPSNLLAQRLRAQRLRRIESALLKSASDRDAPGETNSRLAGLSRREHRPRRSGAMLERSTECRTPQPPNAWSERPHGRLAPPTPAARAEPYSGKLGRFRPAQSNDVDSMKAESPQPAAVHSNWAAPLEPSPCDSRHSSSRSDSTSNAAVARHRPLALKTPPASRTARQQCEGHEISCRAACPE